MGITTVLKVDSKSKASIEQKYDLLCQKIEKKLRVKGGPRGSFKLTLDTYMSTRQHQVSVMPPNALGQTHTAETLQVKTFNKEFYSISLSEYPASTFIISKPNPVKTQLQVNHSHNHNQNQGHPVSDGLSWPEPHTDNITVADKNVIGIINTIAPKSFEVQNKKQISATGNRYTFSDFVIIPAIVYVAGQPRGLTLSIEYCPAIIAELSEPLLQEFVDSLKISSSVDGESEQTSADSGTDLEDSIELVVSPVKRVIQTNTQPQQISVYRTQETILQYLKVLNEIRLQPVSYN